MNKKAIEALHQIFSEYPDLNLKSGEILIEPEDTIEHLFFLKKGTIKMYAISPAGDDVIINRFTAPAVLPLMIILSSYPNPFYFETANSVVVTKAPVKEVLPLIQASQPVWHDVTSRFAEAIYGLATRVMMMASVKQKYQLLSLLKYLAKRESRDSNKKPNVCPKMTHGELASWLGCARETISRLLKQLEKDGEICYRRGRIILTEIES